MDAEASSWRRRVLVFVSQKDCFGRFQKTDRFQKKSYTGRGRQIQYLTLGIGRILWEHVCFRVLFRFGSNVVAVFWMSTVVIVANSVMSSGLVVIAASVVLSFVR